MIITVTASTQKSVSWLKYIFMKKIDFEEKNIKNKVNLLNIKVKTKNGKINWEKLAKLFGNNNVEILCSEKINIPDNLNLKKFRSSEYRRRLSVNTALEVLKLSRIKANSIKILFIDSCGKYVKDIHNFLKFSNQICVFTENKRVYEREENNIMKQYGASLLITDNIKLSSNYNFIISPEIFKNFFIIEKESYVFTSGRSNFWGGEKVIFDYEVQIPQEYKKYKPQEISDNEFLEAIFYEQEFEDLKNIVPKRCRLHNKNILLQELAKEIRDRY